MDLIAPLHIPNCRVKSGKMTFTDKDGTPQTADVWIHVETGENPGTLGRNADYYSEQMMELIENLEDEGCTSISYEETICPFEYPIDPEIFTCVMEGK